MAASMAEMVEAHLLNVKREVQTLTERKQAVEQEILKLQNYFVEGEQTLNEWRSAQKPTSSVQSIFGGN